MKKLITVFFVQFALMISLFGQESKGINFLHNKMWGEALQMAREQNKLIFLDAYTTWCGPCKMLAKNVFTDSKVGEVYNNKFINVKMNMEKDEGLILAKRYEVKAYPTLLFINHRGDVMHRVLGYHDIEEFLELADAATDPSKSTSALNARYNKGDKSPDFLRSYAVILDELGDERAPYVAEEYLMKTKDWKSEENYKFVTDFATNMDSPIFKYVVDNKGFFEEKIGKEGVTKIINNAVIIKYLTSTYGNFQEAEQAFKKFYPEKSDQLFQRYKLTFLERQPDFNAYAKEVISYYNKYPSKDPQELNAAAWEFYEKSDDKSQLKKALKWAETSCKLDKSYYNMDTKCALLYKLGKKSKALAAGKEAIEIAKKNGEEYKETENLMTKINQLK